MSSRVRFSACTAPIVVTIATFLGVGLKVPGSSGLTKALVLSMLLYNAGAIIIPM